MSGFLRSSTLSLDMFIDGWLIDSVCILYLISASSRCRLRLLLYYGSNMNFNIHPLGMAF